MGKTIKTLDDIITREDRYDIKKIAFFQQTDDLELITLDKTLMDIYIPLVRNYLQVFPCLPKERRFYRFKPQLFSLDVYGTPSLFWLIMLLNDRECPSKFYLKQTVNLIPSSVIAEAYTLMSTRSSAQIKENWGKYLKQVGEEIRW